MTLASALAQADQRPLTPWLDDGDVRLYHGDALDVLSGLPDESVDCVVTSPPYWGLRDYGTGEWDGGDPECDHRTRPNWTPEKMASSTLRGRATNQNHEREGYKDVCGKCGATRVDQQLGLEATPDMFVTAMVEVFREVRRVLAPHGTCWVNLGDSYNANTGRGFDTNQDGDKNQRKASAASQRIPWGKPKDLVGIPWRVAFALQADGWYLRSDIVWAKPNPMPESVTDRPTKSHEYVFLLTRQPGYFFDQEAVREPLQESSLERSYSYKDPQNYVAPKVGISDPKTVRSNAGFNTNRYVPSGRNIRSVWQIATQPYPEAHFATFPEELARRCILAGCPVRVCRVCGKASERIVETNNPSKHAADPDNTLGWANTHSKTSNAQSSKSLHRQPGGVYSTAVTLGWTDCGHNAYRPGVVLDPFIGSGTVAKVARDHGRHSVGIDLNEQYLELAARRLQQLSLLSEPA